MSIEEGKNLSNSAYAKNGHSTRYMNDDERKVYSKRLDKGLPTYLNPTHQKLAWNCTKQPGLILQEVCTKAYFDKKGQKNGNRVAKCTECQEVRFGSENIKHRCLVGLEDLSPEEIHEIEANKKTLTLSRIVWPHDMVDHPSHGITTWARCETPTGVTAFLDSLGLIRIDTSKFLRSRWADVSSFIDTLNGLELGSIVVEKVNPDPEYTLAMAVDKWIQARGRKTVPLGGPIPHDFHLDDRCLGKTTNVLKAVQSGKPLSLFACRATPSYGFTAVAVLEARIGGHECSTVYGPLVSAAGYRYVNLYHEKDS